MTVDRLRDFLIGLNKRRKELGMTLDALAQRSGLARATVDRLLRGCTSARIDRVAALADALGVELTFKDTAKPEEMVQKQAELQARRICGMTQGTMGLESQAVGSAMQSQMYSRAYHTLVSGPRKKLWYQ